MPDGVSLTNAYAHWRSTILGQITDRLEKHLILDLLGPSERRNILDVGCGDGDLAAALASHGANVAGLDTDPHMLDAARTRAEAESLNLALVCGRAENLPFADDTFDRVVAVTVLCFIPQADRAISEMGRVLKPGGRLVIGELGRWSLWAAIRRIRGWLGDPTWSSAHFRTAASLRHLLERNGLAVREIRGAVYYPPSDFAAPLMAGVDPWLGRRTIFGAAFVAASASKIDRNPP